MTIQNNKNGSALSLALEGRLDTTTAPELDEVLKGSLDGVTELTMDLEKLEYLSSAGLRVLLSAQKTMNKQGSMVRCVSSVSTTRSWRSLRSPAFLTF